MKRRVNTEDFRSLGNAKEIVDRAFDSDTQWFPDELSDLHAVSSALARTLSSLEQETAIQAIAHRIIAQPTTTEKIAFAIIGLT